jgi:hypothetical protein
MAERPSQTRFQIRFEAVGDRLAAEKMADAYGILVPQPHLEPELNKEEQHEQIGGNLCPSLLGAPERGQDNR